MNQQNFVAPSTPSTLYTTTIFCSVVAARLLRAGSIPVRWEELALVRGALGESQTYQNSPSLLASSTFAHLDLHGLTEHSDLIDVAANPTRRADGN